MDLEQNKQGDLNQAEFDQLASVLLPKRFDQDRKKKWAAMLKTEHGLEKKQESATTTTPQAKAKRVYLWLAAAAAAILLVFLAFPLMEQNATQSYQALADAYIQSDFQENPSVIKGDQTVETQKLNAIYAYNDKDFPKAIQFFKAAQTQADFGDEDYLYFGLSYLYNQQYTQAIEQLVKIEKDSRFQQEQQWYLSLAYLKAEQLEAAKKTLKQIQPDMWNYEKAQDLLEAM